MDLKEWKLIFFFTTGTGGPVQDPIACFPRGLGGKVEDLFEEKDPICYVSTFLSWQCLGACIPLICLNLISFSVQIFYSNILVSTLNPCS